MSNLSKKVRLAIAGTLLALTGLAAGLTMSVVFNAQASAPAASSNAVVASQANTNSAAVADVAPSTYDQVTGDEDGGFDFTFDTFDPASMVQGMMQQLPPEAVAQFQAVAGPFGFGGGPETQGTISKIDGNNITLSRNISVTVNADTKYGDASGDLKQSDLKVGDRVFVLGKVETNKSVTARWVLRLPALPSVERGKFVSANGKQFTFTVGKNNDTWTATTTDTTTITKNGNKAALTDLAKDDVITVIGQADSTNKTIAADRVTVGKPVATPVARGNGAGGAVKSVDVSGNSLVITQKGRNGAADTDVKVTVDKDTRFVGQNVTGLGDLKAGDNVLVQGDKQTDGSIKAKVVAKAPAAGGRGTGPGGFPFGGPNGGNRRGGQPNATPTPNQ